MEATTAAVNVGQVGGAANTIANGLDGVHTSLTGLRAEMGQMVSVSMLAAQQATNTAVGCMNTAIALLRDVTPSEPGKIIEQEARAYRTGIEQNMLVCDISDIVAAMDGLATLFEQRKAEIAALVEGSDELQTRGHRLHDSAALAASRINPPSRG